MSHRAKMAIAIYMTRKDGDRNLNEARIDQVFVIPAGERFRGIDCRPGNLVSGAAFSWL
jgi:hypothetical protein